MSFGFSVVLLISILGQSVKAEEELDGLKRMASSLTWISLIGPPQLSVQLDAMGKKRSAVAIYKLTVNTASEVDSYPLPMIEDLFASL